MQSKSYQVFTQNWKNASIPRVAMSDFRQIAKEIRRLIGLAGEWVGIWGGIGGIYLFSREIARFGFVF